MTITMPHVILLKLHTLPCNKIRTCNDYKNGTVKVNLLHCYGCLIYKSLCAYLNFKNFAKNIYNFRLSVYLIVQWIFMGIIIILIKYKYKYKLLDKK